MRAFKAVSAAKELGWSETRALTEEKHASGRLKVLTAAALDSLKRLLYSLQ